MGIEWQFKNTSTDSTHNNGLEWRVSAPAIDVLGNVYAYHDDGSLYAIAQGGALAGTSFVKQSFGADTQTSVGPDGKIFVQTGGTLFAVGR